MAHVVSGRLNKQIAADLGTSEITVKIHRQRVMRKMQAESLAELVRLAARIEPHVIPRDNCLPTAARPCSCHEPSRPW